MKPASSKTLRGIETPCELPSRRIVVRSSTLYYTGGPSRYKYDDRAIPAYRDVRLPTIAAPACRSLATAVYALDRAIKVAMLQRDFIAFTLSIEADSRMTHVNTCSYK